MERSINQEIVNDTAKLLVHRLIAREIGRDPLLVERARCRHVQQAERYDGHAFVREWDALLQLPPTRLRGKLVSRDSEMVRLRISSPFPLVTRINLTDYSFRLRIRRAAKRVVLRRLRKSRPDAAPR